MRRCLESAFGLAVEGGGVTATDDGCVVDLPTSQGQVEVVLPTLHSGFAAASAVVTTLGALWPIFLLMAYSRKVR
jgi:hypothetical protein